jgi:hypothetical protein
MTDDDVTRLSRLFNKITKHILLIKNNNLIEYLRIDVKLIENFHSIYNTDITDIVNRLAEKKIYYDYFKTFTAILKYFLIAVQKFCQRNFQIPIRSIQRITKLY